jgi:hypothetical protein
MSAVIAGDAFETGTADEPKPQRRSARLGLTDQYAGMVELHPCDPCQHSARCAAGLACRALVHFVATGRISEVAPRHPSAAIYAQIYQPPPQAPRRSSTMLAISLLNADPGRLR